MTDSEQHLDDSEARMLEAVRTSSSEAVVNTLETLPKDFAIVRPDAWRELIGSNEADGWRRLAALRLLCTFGITLPTPIGAFAADVLAGLGRSVGDVVDAGRLQHVPFERSGASTTGVVYLPLDVPGQNPAIYLQLSADSEQIEALAFVDADLDEAGTGEEK